MFLLGRLGAMVVLAWGITLIAFILTHLVPIDPVAATLGPDGLNDPAIVKAFREHYGLDKPLPDQYALYLTALVHGDLGESEQSHRPVLTDLEEYIPATAELAVTSTILASLFGIGLGMLGARWHRKAVDHILRVVSLTGMSTPTFWLGLVCLYIFYFRLGWLPGSGRLDANIDGPSHLTGLYTIDSLVAGQWGTFVNAIQHLILPAFALAAYNIGLLTRLTRAAVLDVAREDYIAFARR